MASTYTTLLKTEQQADGENSGTWGQKANVVFVLLEEAMAGMETIAVTGGTKTLSDTQGVSNEARNAILKFTGTLTSNSTVEIPARSKKYTVWNATNGAYTLTIGVSGGTAVTVPQGARLDVFTDGTDTYETYSEMAKVGEQELFVPASAMAPTTTGGCGALKQVEVSSGKPEMVGLPFDKGTDESAQFIIALPKSWNNSTITFQPIWTADDATTNSVVWAMDAVSMADNDTLAGTYGTAQSVTDANGGASYAVRVGAESNAITIAGSPASGELQAFRIYRDADNVSDTLAADAILLGLKLRITTNAPNDE